MPCHACNRVILIVGPDWHGELERKSQQVNIFRIALFDEFCSFLQMTRIEIAIENLQRSNYQSEMKVCGLYLRSPFLDVFGQLGNVSDYFTNRVFGRSAFGIFKKVLFFDSRPLPELSDPCHDHCDHLSVKNTVV